MVWDLLVAHEGKVQCQNYFLTQDVSTWKFEKVWSPTWTAQCKDGACLGLNPSNPPDSVICQIFNCVAICWMIVILMSLRLVLEVIHIWQIAIDHGWSYWCLCSSQELTHQLCCLRRVLAAHLFLVVLLNLLVRFQMWQYLWWILALISNRDPNII